MGTKEFMSTFVFGPVDLGLSAKWANANVGANTLTDYGDFRGWGTDPGNGWRIPTKGEWEELKNNCRWEWFQINGIPGRKITASNGNSIFLPAGGYHMDNGHYCEHERGYYWTSDGKDNRTGWNFYFGEDFIRTDNFNKYLGFNLCAVQVQDQ